MIVHQNPRANLHNFPAVIVDLDGTLADIEHRRHLVADSDKAKRDYDKFGEMCGMDSPNLMVLRIVNALHDCGVCVAIMTGREMKPSVYKKTKQWLNKYEVSWDIMFARDEGDYRDDRILKGEFYERLCDMGHEPFGVLEDRPKVVKMWREYGLFVLNADQTAYGEEF